MKIMVVGGGGREHAIIKKLRENKAIEEIFALPGNGGMAEDATLVPIGAKDIDAIVKFASENKIDYAVVAPDDPLVLGCVDRLTEIGIGIPQITAFTKTLMDRGFLLPHAAVTVEQAEQMILNLAKVGGTADVS